MIEEYEYQQAIENQTFKFKGIYHENQKKQI